jgi:hypothetical protein
MKPRFWCEKLIFQVDFQRKKLIKCSNTLVVSVLKVDVLATICTAQLQARSALCFISLIKSLNLNFAGLLKYFAAHHGRPNLKAKSFTRPFAARTALWLVLVLLVSRQLIMAAARVKLTSHS